MVNTPEELRKKELEKQKEHEEIIRARVSHICSLVTIEFEAEVNEGKITSKGGVVKYPAHLEESEVPVVIDYFAKKGWEVTVESKEESAKILFYGEKLMKTRYYFNLTPVIKK